MVESTNSRPEDRDVSRPADVEDLAPDAPPSTQQRAKAAESSRAFDRKVAVMLFLLTLLAVATAVVFGTNRLHQLAHESSRSRLTQWLGSVQRVTYVGGFHTRTQVDTETRTVLLLGVVDLKRGTRLELRPLNADGDVCDLDGGACYRRAVD